MPVISLLVSYQYRRSQNQLLAQLLFIIITCALNESQGKGSGAAVEGRSVPIESICRLIPVAGK
jgi:hypothetical protein